MEVKKRRSLSVSKGKQQNTVQSGSACAREEGEASLAVGPVPHSLEHQQQPSIFIPSNLCSQDSSASQPANPSQAKGQAPDTPSSSLGKRRKVPVQRLGEVDNFEKELEFALRLSAAEANHNLKLTPSRKHPPQSDGVVTDAGASVGQAQHDLSLELKAHAAHASSSSLGEFPAEVPALEHSEGPTHAAEKVRSVTPASKGKTAETPAAMTSDDVSARKTKKKRKVIQSDDDDDFKQSPSKHALAPTDPLQVEADSIPDSEDESAKRIECVVGAGLNKEAATGEKEPASKRCRLQQDSSEDEVQSSTTLEHSDSKKAHPAKGAPHAKAAQGGGKKKKASSDDDENSEDEEYSEAEESDDDFESEEDEDFKVKKGKKGKGISDKYSKKGKGESQKDSKMAAVVAATATGVGGISNAFIRGRQAPPAIEPPPISKNGGKKTRAEKEIEKLAFQNPGVKAAVVKVRGAKICVPPTPQIMAAVVHQDNAAFSGLSAPENHQNLPKNVSAAANSKDKDTHTLTSSTTSSELQSSTTLERSDSKSAHPAKCAPYAKAEQGGGKKKKASSDDDENSEDEEYSEAEESDDDFESEEDENSKDQKDKKGKGKSDKYSKKGKGKSQKDSTMAAVVAATATTIPQAANSMTSRPISAISTAAPEVAARPGTSTDGVGGSKAGAKRVAPSAHLPPPSAAHSGCVSSGGPTLASRPPRVGLVRFGPVTSLHGAAGGGSALGSAGRGSGLKITGGQQGVRRPGLQKNVKVHQQLHQRYD